MAANHDNAPRGTREDAQQVWQRGAEDFVFGITSIAASCFHEQSPELLGPLIVFLAQAGKSRLNDFRSHNSGFVGSKYHGSEGN